jgi:4-amino-4-deoxy-L-arabinose transferase-like glycosyltransferase
MLDSAIVTTAKPPIRARSAEEGACRISWPGALLPLVLMGACFFGGLSAIGLTGPDEPRYAGIAREMARSGDWVTPRLNGQPWFEKPVLYYWFAGAAYRIFGEGEFAMRLPSVLAAVLATLATAWAALRAYGLETARLALWMLPVTVGLIGFSHAAAPDMLFSGFLAAAAAAAAEMLEKPRAGMLGQVTLGMFLGAAALAKGPAAVLLAGGAVLLWALVSRRLAAALRFFHPVCLAAFAAIAVPWYAVCAARNPEFFRVFFVEHNLQRYLTPVFQHPQPIWFFSPVACVAIFPWTALLLPLGLDALRARQAGKWRDSPTLFFACWALAPLVFFSFSESKLPGYILPSVPPLILILAWTLARRFSSVSHSPRIWIALVAATFPLLSLVAVYWLGRVPQDSVLTATNAWLGLLGLAALGGLGCVALAWARRERASVAATASLTAMLVLAASGSVLPGLDPYLSARTAARITTEEAGPVALVSVLEVDRPLQLGLEYYLDRPVPLWAPNSAHIWVWTTAAQVADLQTRGARFTVANRLSPHAWLVRMEQPPGF